MERRFIIRGTADYNNNKTTNTFILFKFNQNLHSLTWRGGGWGEVQEWGAGKRKKKSPASSAS